MTLAELASKYDVHPTQITGWKRQAKEGMVAAFSGKAGTVQKDAGVAISMDGKGRWMDGERLYRMVVALGEMGVCLPARTQYR